MALAFGEADDLVLDRRTVARPDTLDLAGIERRPADIGPDLRVGPGIRVGDVANSLRNLDPVGQKRERRRRIVAFLCFKRRPIDRPAVETRRRPGLQPPERQAEPAEGPGQPRRRRRIDPAGRPGLLAQMDDPAQKGARRDHDGAGADRPAVFQNDPGASAVSVDGQIAGRALDDLEARLPGQDGLHCRAIQLAVGLGARAADRRTLAAVQHAKLDAGPVDRPRHDAVQRIDLAHQMALCQTADRRVHDMTPMVSRLWVSSTVRAPARAAADAASQPAWPPPITTTSAFRVRVVFIWPEFARTPAKSSGARGSGRFRGATPAQRQRSRSRCFT